MESFGLWSLKVWPARGLNNFISAASILRQMIKLCICFSSKFTLCLSLNRSLYKHIAEVGTYLCNEHSQVQGPKAVKWIDVSAAIQNYVKLSIENSCIGHQNDKPQTQGCWNTWTKYVWCQQLLTVL